jgi:hypothetical protein
MQEGRFSGRCTGVFRFGESSTGNTQLGLEFLITEPGEARGKRDVWYGTLGSAESTKLAADVIAACTGQPLRSWAAFAQRAEQRPDGALYHKALTLQEVSLVYTEDEYEGTTRVRLSFVNTAGGVPMKNILEGGALAKALGTIDKTEGNRATVPVDDDFPF